MTCSLSPLSSDLSFLLSYFSSSFFFFFNDTATTEIYTLSLHDALPICARWRRCAGAAAPRPRARAVRSRRRSEEHTSELQSHLNLVCRLLLEKKKKTIKISSERKCITISPQLDKRNKSVLIDAIIIMPY